jgi:cytochrome c peroxidase
MLKKSFYNSSKKMLLVTAVVTFPVISGQLISGNLTDKVKLGKKVFFDKNLSIYGNQSCASCHAVEVGFVGPNEIVNASGAVVEGSVSGRFGNRKPPSAAYAANSPILATMEVNDEVIFFGGNFYNGRATGHKLGNPAADQSQMPFVNPVEQGLPDSACVVYRVCNSGKYGKGALLERMMPGACDIKWPEKNEVKKVCKDKRKDKDNERLMLNDMPNDENGDDLNGVFGMLNLSPQDRLRSDDAYDQIGISIGAFEGSNLVNKFNSKFDAVMAGREVFTEQEALGFELFKGQGQCAACHTLEPGPNGEAALLTDFTYDNLGVPKNPENPWYSQVEFNPEGRGWVDLGLGGFLASTPTDLVPDYTAFAQSNMGKQKVPTLRNVDKRPYDGFVKAFMHNGYFKSLKGVVHFYNTRDTKPVCADSFTTEAGALEQRCWPVAEVEANVNRNELGDLGLSDQQEDAIVSFMKTLSDR